MSLAVPGAAPAAAPATGKGVVVAVVDSGVDPRVGGLGTRLAQGVDLVDGDAVPFDENGHGTMVARTIVGSARPGGPVGIAPEATILAVRVLDARARGPLERVAAGVRWAVAHGADVVNVSIGEEAGSGTALGGPLNDAFAAAWAAGAVVVVSAGNGGRVGPVLLEATPALVVGSADAEGTPLPYSNTGDPRELYAPGTVDLGGPGSTNFSGTSASAAIVSGVVAGLLSAGTPASRVPSILRSACRQGQTSRACALDVAELDASSRGRLSSCSS